MNGLACSFTGHREIETNHWRKIDDLVLRAINFAYEHGCRRFYSGGAIGFDTVAARQVILFRLSHPDVELHMLIPCKNQSERWTEKQKDMYEYILSQANTVVFMSDGYKPGCMRARNARLVEVSTIVVAYVNRDKSGAAQTVRMAKRAGKTVYNLYPTLDKDN